MSRATRNTPFSALSSSAVSMVFWTVSSMLFLHLSFLVYSGDEGLGRSVPDDSEHRLRAATALRAAAAGGVDIAWAVGAASDGVPDLHIAQRVAEANIHPDGLRPCGQSSSGSRGGRRCRWRAPDSGEYAHSECRAWTCYWSLLSSVPDKKHVSPPAFQDQIGCEHTWKVSFGTATPPLPRRGRARAELHPRGGEAAHRPAAAQPADSAAGGRTRGGAHRAQ